MATAAPIPIPLPPVAVADPSAAAEASAFAELLRIRRPLVVTTSPSGIYAWVVDEVMFIAIAAATVIEPLEVDADGVDPPPLLSVAPLALARELPKLR